MQTVSPVQTGVTLLGVAASICTQLNNPSSFCIILIRFVMTVQNFLSYMINSSYMQLTFLSAGLIRQEQGREAVIVGNVQVSTSCCHMTHGILGVEIFFSREEKAGRTCFEVQVSRVIIKLKNHRRDQYPWKPSAVASPTHSPYGP